MLRLTILILFSYSATAVAHGGGLDKTGGHHNRKTGEYHCHREPCISTHKQVESATNDAEQEGASYSTLYDRDDWEHWIDEDGDCQDTRAEILIRDSQQPAVLYSNGCEVSNGLWRLPYTGGFVTDPSQIDIDHIVPLKWAHGHGGDRWSADRKRAFANDPENLLAVYYSANRAKGAKGPDDWMPAINQCEYAESWQRLVSKYGLEMVSIEQAAILKACQ